MANNSPPILIGLCPLTLGRAIYFMESTNSNANLICKTFTDTSRNNIWSGYPVAHSTWHMKLTITDKLKSLPPIPVDLSLFEDGIFVDVLKTKSLGWPLIQYDGHPYKKREIWGHTYTHRGGCHMNRGTCREVYVTTKADMEYGAASQATLWTDGHFQKLGGGKNLPRISERAWPGWQIGFRYLNSRTVRE